MEISKPIVGINLALLVMYTIGMCVESGSEGLAWGALIMGFHGCVCLVIGLILLALQYKPQGKSFLMCTGLLWLIGLSSCGIGLGLN